MVLNQYKLGIGILNVNRYLTISLLMVLFVNIIAKG